MSGVLLPSLMLLLQTVPVLGLEPAQCLAEVPEYPLQSVSGVASSPDGQVLVWQELGHEVLRFDSGGAFLGAIGRGGDGPGEFTGAHLVGFRDETLWVYDYSLRRISEFSMNGEFLGLIADKNTLGRFGPRFQVAGLLSGARVVGARRTSKPGESSHRPLVSFGVDPESADAEMVDTLSSVYAVHLGQPLDMGQLSMMVFGPVEESSLWAVSRDGKSTVILRQAPDPEVPEGTFELSFLDESGRTTTSVAYSPKAIDAPLRDSLFEPMVGRFSEAFPDMERSAILRSLRRGFELPKFLPPVAQLVVTQDGGVWVGRAGTISQGRLWEIYSSNGELQGRLRTGPRTTIRTVDRDSVWAAVTDEWDVVSVCRFGLVEKETDRP